MAKQATKKIVKVVEDREFEPAVDPKTFTDSDIVELYGEKEIRWYQIAARNMLTASLKRGIKRNLIVMPTGSGKTLTIACTLDQNPELLEVLGVKGRKLRVLYMAHLDRLLVQAARTFQSEHNVELKICTPFTNIPTEDLEWADVVVIDEAQHEAMHSVQLQLDKMAEKPIIGLTATPDRADGMVLKFENIIQPMSREQAVQEGWLAETSVWSIVDLSGKDKVPLICQTINVYHEIMRKTIIFTRTRKEGASVARYIESLGLSVVLLDQQTKSQVSTILDDFSKGKYQFVVNCSKIGEGVDCAGVVSIIIGKNLGSYMQLNQYIGRTARPDDDSQVFEFINPLSGTNLDTTVVIGTPKRHVLCEPMQSGEFIEREFNYTATAASGISAPKKMGRRRQ